MIKKVTSNILKYPSGYEPDYIIPKEYCEYRFALGKHGTNPLVVICMNPSAAKENPRHPLQRNEKWDFTKKNYL